MNDFLILVTYEDAARLQRHAPRELATLTPNSPKGVLPLLALATDETAQHHAQMHVSNWALTDQQRRRIAAQLTKRAAFVLANPTPIEPMPSTP
jgi:hypothetical protein